jgi:hypothetical protein
VRFEMRLVDARQSRNLQVHGREGCRWR